MQDTKQTSGRKVFDLSAKRRERELLTRDLCDIKPRRFAGKYCVIIERLKFSRQVELPREAYYLLLSGYLMMWHCHWEDLRRDNDFVELVLRLETQPPDLDWMHDLVELLERLDELQRGSLPTTR